MEPISPHADRHRDTDRFGAEDSGNAAPISPTSRPGSDRSSRAAAIRGAMALGLLLLFVFPMGNDTLRAYGGGWSKAAPIRAHGRFDEVLAAQGRNRMVNVSIALAARWIAHGEPRALLLPVDQGALTDRPPDLFGNNSVPAMQWTLTQVFVGGHVRRAVYEPRVRSDVFDGLLADGDPVREFPFDVYAVRKRGLAGVRLIAVGDLGSDRIAIIPLPMSPIDTCTEPSDDAGAYCTDE